MVLHVIYNSCELPENPLNHNNLGDVILVSRSQGKWITLLTGGDTQAETILSIKSSFGNDMCHSIHLYLGLMKHVCQNCWKIDPWLELCDSFVPRCCNKGLQPCHQWSNVRTTQGGSRQMSYVDLIVFRTGPQSTRTKILIVYVLCHIFW